MDGEQSESCGVNPEGGVTTTKTGNLQPWPNKHPVDADEQHHQESNPEEYKTPQTPTHVWGPPLNDPEVGCGPQHNQLPWDPHPLQLGWKYCYC